MGWSFGCLHSSWGRRGAAGGGGLGVWRTPRRAGDHPAKARCRHGGRLCCAHVTLKEPPPLPPPPLDREVRTVSTEKRTQHGTHPSSAGRYEMHACTHFLVCACAVSGRHPDTGGPRRRDQGPGPGGGGWEGLSPSRFPARARPHYAARRPCPVRAHGQESIQSPSGALLVTSCLLLTQLPGNCPKGSGGPRPDVGSGQSPAP